MFIKYLVSNEHKPKHGQLLIPQSDDTSVNSFTEVDYFKSLQVVSDFIIENAIENPNFPIDKNTFYAKYVDYCMDLKNVSPVSKRSFTTYLTVLLAHHDYMLIITKLPNRKVVLSTIKNYERPRHDRQDKDL